MPTIEERLAAVEAKVQTIPWTCQYCDFHNETAQILWPTARFTLICAACSKQQSYPDNIRKQDPAPSW